jgi:hypothetical protein
VNFKVIYVPAHIKPNKNNRRFTVNLEVWSEEVEMEYQLGFSDANANTTHALQCLNDFTKNPEFRRLSELVANTRQLNIEEAKGETD